ncbi:RBBP9/YdeN family alpha/beta hydrolase [Streptomyces sp. NPDC060209]|uniref:RBBP9/YdeN family alpha/beta hydrolase n=1 Tax=Streptomyces sp. NPDC060209 TaxID=3347073 RepID=UPI00364F58AE
MVAYVIIPGIGGSDERHWQSLWEDRWGTSAVRIAPGSWTAPDLRDWVDSVQTAYELASGRDEGRDEGRGEGRDGRVVLVAHSLGCWAAAQWLDRARPRGVAAFLVAPPDRRGPAFPREAASTFLDLTARPLPGRSLMVTSDDDPYCDPTASATLAAGWQTPWRSVGEHGHINSGSGLGDWQAGRELLRALVDGSAAS